MNILRCSLSKVIRIAIVLIISSCTIVFSNAISDAASPILNLKSAQFWKNSAFGIVTVKSWRKRKHARGIYLAHVRVLSILAAEHPIQDTLNIWIYNQNPFICQGPIHPGGTFIIFMQMDRQGRWFIPGDTATGLIPHDANSWPVKGISDPVVSLVSAQIKKLTTAAGVHPRAWISHTSTNQIHSEPTTAPGINKQIMTSSWLPWGHGYTVETGINFRERFWATNSVVVLRISRLLPQRYIAAYYPPMATEISARVVLVCATDLPVPTKIKLTCIWAKGIVGKVLPPFRVIKPGALFLANIYTPKYWYGRNKGKVVRNWLIQPNILVAFMPNKMSLVPISGLNDPKLQQTEIKVAAVRKEYWKGWAKYQLAHP